MDLKDKVAVVTGGSRGIGLSIAAALLGEGARVYLCARDEAGLRSALERLGASDGRADGCACDVRRHAACRAMIERAAARFGGIDILINNAGIGVFKPVDELTPEEWDATIETNLSGVFYCSREAIPHLRRRGGGSIVNVSSLAGINAFAGGAAYNASKFGLNGFSEAMMQDIRHDGIRVSYIMPGSVDTDFSGPGSPGGSWKLQGDDVAEAVIDVLKLHPRALASRVEIRPSRPKKH